MQFSYTFAIGLSCLWSLTCLGSEQDKATGIRTTAQSNSAFCDSEWKRLSLSMGTAEQGRQTLLKEWLKLQERCKATGIYEYRLASLYNSLGQPDQARQLVDDALKLPDKAFGHYLTTLKLSFRFQDLLRAKDADVAKYKAVISAAHNVAISNPEWPLSFELMANVYLFLDEHDDAIGNAERAIALDSSLWPPRRVLVMAYTSKSQFEKARLNIARAIELNDQLLGNADFMYAATWTYTGSVSRDTHPSQDPNLGDCSGFGASLRSANYLE